MTMRCPCCGAAELINDTRAIPHTYEGEATTIPEVTGDFCPACGEVILNREQGDRYNELILQFNKQVNALKNAEQLASVKTEVISLSFRDQECFAQALLSPAQPSDSLVRAFAHHSKIFSDSQVTPKEDRNLEK